MPPRAVPPVRPNLGLQAAYRRRLEAMTAEMHADVMAALRESYAANEPEMAKDASPAMELRRAVRRLRRRWLRRFDDASAELAEWFARDATERSDKQLEAILRRAGMTVRFHMTPAVQDANQAAIGENIGLIRSIPEQYLTQVEGHVMRAVQVGGKLGPLTRELEQQFGVTKRRAAFIAGDQNAKATAVITRARQKELGITQAIWMHSTGGKHPRPEHLAFNGKVYDVDKGAYLEGKWTFPGHEINCRCVSRSIIPGLTS